MTLTEQLVYSLYIGECEKSLRAAKSEPELVKASTCLDQPEFNAITAQAREDLTVLYLERLQKITGALIA